MSRTFYFSSNGSRCCLRFYVPDGLDLVDVLKTANDAKACAAIMQQAFPPDMPSIRISEPTLQSNANGAYWQIVVNVNKVTLAGAPVANVVEAISQFNRGFRTLLSAQGFGRGKA